MSNFLPEEKEQKFVSIHEAAGILGVSTKTLRRWDKKGVLTSLRTQGDHRRYPLTQITNFKEQRDLKPIKRALQSNYKFSKEAPVLFKSLHSKQKRALVGLWLGFLLALNLGLAASLQKYQSTTKGNKTLTGKVLQAATVLANPKFFINIPTFFRDEVTFEGGITASELATFADIEIGGTLTLAGTLDVPGDLTVGGDITSTATTFNLLNTTTTSLNFANAATTISLGATTGTTTINNNLLISDNLTGINGVTYSFPSSQGSASTFLKNNGSGTLTWSTVTADLSTATGTLGFGSGGTGSTTTLTAGSVIFSDGTKLTQDNTNFFWNDTTNILTIGSSGAINPTVDQGADLGSPTRYWNNIYVANINTSSTLSSLGQLVVTYDPAATTYTEASVLINPTAPAANEILLGVGYGGYEKAGFDREGDLVLGYNNLVTAPTSDNPLRIYNHSSTLLATIDTSGNFGLSNSAPTSTLDVAGSAALRGNFTYQKAVTLTNGGGTLTDHDVLVELDTATLISAAKMQSDCDDIRFTDSNKTTALSFWIEQGCNTATTQIWVRVPSIPTGTKDIYLSYGNSTAVSDSISWPGNFIFMSNTSCPAGWTTLSGVGGVLNARFPRGSSTYGGSSDVSTHTHTASGTIPATSAFTCNALPDTTSWATSGHTHSYSFTTGSSSQTPPYVDVVFCGKTAPIELVPTTLIGMFSSAPTGWTNVAALNTKFPRGAASYGGTGGSATHQNAVGSTTTGAGAGAGNWWANLTPGQGSGHTHTFSGNVDVGDNTPPYEDFIMSTPDSAAKMVAGMTGIFSATPPLGWTRKSSLDNGFARGNSTGGGTGGAATHTHTFTNFTTSTGSAPANYNNSGAGCIANGTHTHTFSGTTAAATNTPAYLDTLYYTRNTPSATTSVGSETSNAGTAPVDFYYNPTTTNVGVGTSAPLWKLHVQDAQTATASALIENTANASTNDPTVLNIRLGNDATTLDNGDRLINFMRGDATIIGKIQGNGSGGVLYTTTGTDFAEYFEKESEAEPIEPGDLVCLNTNGKLTRCDGQNRGILGAISDRAGFVGGMEHENDPKYALVGLMGQVPVKVATEAGTIKAGDSLTYSSIPGVAKKANETGYTLGKALESFADEGIKRIMVYVNPSWFDQSMALTNSGDIEGVEIAQDQNLTVNVFPTTEATPSAEIAEIKEKLSNLESDILLLKNQELIASSSASLAETNILDTALLGNTVINGTLNIGTIQIDNLENSIDAIGILKIQPLALGSLEFMNDYIEIDTNGNLSIKKGVILGNDSFRGSETLLAGETTLKIERDWETSPTTINLTPNYNTNLWVSEKSETGFVINVDQAPLEDAIIDWLAIW